MKKETAMKYADLLTEKSRMCHWYDYDSTRKTWFVCNICGRIFFTVKELKNYAGGKLK